MLSRLLLAALGLLATPVTATQEPVAVVSGRFLDRKGAPLPEAGVVLVRQPIQTLAESHTAADGRFRLEVSDTGAAQLQFFAPGRGYFFLPVMVAPALKATVDVHLMSSSDSAASYVSVTSATSPSGRLLALTADALSEQAKYAFLRRQGDSTRPYDWTPAVNRVTRRLQHERSPLVRQGAYLALLRYQRLGAEVPATEVGHALAAVPADSRIWSLEPDMATLAGEPCRKVGPIAPCVDYFEQSSTTHADSLVRQWMLMGGIELALGAGDTAQAGTFLDELRARHPDSPLLPHAEAALEPETGLRAGQPLPPVAIQSLGDTTVVYDNDALHGRTVLIAFWASWCDSCVAQLPTLLAAWRDYHSKGLEILSVTMDNGGARPDPSLPWLQGFTDGFDSPAARALGVTELPRSLLIDSTGTILAVDAALQGNRLRQILAAQFEARR
jgi:thiol-disulfide isomerase/thioredoxin